MDRGQEARLARSGRVPRTRAGREGGHVPSHRPANWRLGVGISCRRDPLPNRSRARPRPARGAAKTCPFEAFNRESRAREGRRADCRECQHERARARSGRTTF